MDTPQPGQPLLEPSEPVAVLLVRHGRTALNAARRLRGRLDPPLDEVGIRQVQRLAQRLTPMLSDGRPHRILTSPLLRATQTAQAIAAHTGLTVERDDRLLDRDYGQWAGMPLEEVLERWGSVDAAPGVEPRPEVRARARSILHEPHAAAPVVLVSHDAVLHAMLEDLDPDAADVRLDPAGWTCLGRHASGALTVLTVNNT